MVFVIKRNPLGEEKLQYPARALTHVKDGVILDAYWELPRRDLGYTIFEPGDHFVEYYYTDRWFNILAISTADGLRKGWYCNIAEPALIKEDRVEQIDLLLDVWVNPDGEPLILDEDEFAADMTLTSDQRQYAQQGLQELLTLIKTHGSPFSDE